MSELEIFEYASSQVRTVMVDGEPWVIAADVCAVLEIGRPQDSVRYLDEDERGTCLVDTPSGEQQMLIVSEAGLYSLILRSRKPEAKQFKRWVTHDLLPQVRRTGSYGQPAAIPTHAEALRGWATEIEAREAAEAEAAALVPRAQLADQLLTADGDLAVADAAKALQRGGVVTGQNRLFEVMARIGWLYRGGDKRWRPYQSAIDSGYLSARAQSHEDTWTGQRVVDAPQIRVTPKGLQRLLDSWNQHAS